MVQLQRIQPELTELGYQILALSPDPPEEILNTIEKHGLTYRVLSDEDLSVARAFGIVFSPQGRRPLPVPAVYLVGTDGLILFQYVNPEYKVRLDPDLLLAAAKAGLKTQK